MAATRIPRSRETTKRMTTPSDHPSRAHPRVIDVQTHYVPPAAARLLHDVRVAGIADALEPNSAICTLDARLRAMDEAEVDVSVLSMAPIGIIADRRLRLDICRAANNGLLEACTAYPQRFVMAAALPFPDAAAAHAELARIASEARSEEHTSELQSLMRISYAVFCLKKKHNHISHNAILQHNQKSKISTKDTTN